MSSSTTSQVDIAYAAIKRAVVAGEFEVGRILTETQLAQFCNVSRTPVREAVQRLEMEHVLVRGERGLAIPNPSPEEIYDIYETRAILEVAATRLAAERRTEVDLAHIDRWVETQRAMTSTKLSDHTTANFEFSKAVWRASHNQSLFELLEKIGIPHAQFGGQTTMSVPGQTERATQHHLELRNAIADRDADLAGKLAHANTLAVRDLRIRMWQELNNP